MADSLEATKPTTTSASKALKNTTLLPESFFPWCKLTRHDFENLWPGGNNGVASAVFSIRAALRSTVSVKLTVRRAGC